MSFSVWKEYEVGDFADILSGYAFKSKDFIEKGIPVIKIKNIVPPVIDINDVQYVSDELYNEKKRYALEFNDILISLTGSNVNQIASAVGKIGRVRLKNEKLLLNQRVGKLYITDKDRCDYNYLYYYLIQEEVRYNLAASAGGSANQANISPAQIKRIKINLPSLQEQKAITNILSTLDEKIETNNQINKKLEEMAQAIFKQWFVDFEFPNENGEPYKSSGGEMIESEMGMIPKGWEIGVFRDYTDTVLGGDWGKENPQGNYTKEVYCLRGADIPEVIVGKKGALPKRYILEKNYNNKKLSNGDLVVEISGGSPTQSTGRISYISDLMINKYEGDFVCTNFCRAITLKSKNMMEFFYFYWTQLYERKTFFQYENGTTGIKNFDINTFLDTFLIVKPTKEVIDKFHNIIETILNTIQSNGSENIKLSETRDKLLPKLMSGEIRVPLNN